MPILAVVFDPPSWWSKLTDNQRRIVVARLQKLGYDVSGWPVTIRAGVGGD